MKDYIKQVEELGKLLIEMKKGLNIKDLLKANPDYDWGEKWTCQGKITKAIIILESENLNVNDVFLARETFQWEAEYLCISHKGNYEYIKNKLAELKEKDNYAFITPDIALLHRRDLDFRPDNIFFIKDGHLRRMDRCTDRALRIGNNLFKLYIANEFEEEMQ